MFAGGAGDAAEGGFVCGLAGDDMVGGGGKVSARGGAGTLEEGGGVRARADLRIIGV